MSQTWVAVRLGYLATVASGKSPPASFDRVAGRFPVFGSNGVIGYCADFLVDRRACLVGRVGASGALNVAPPCSWVSDNALILQFNESRVDFDFGVYALSTMGLAEQITGTAQPLLTGSTLKNQRTPLPPLPTQRVIADFLDRKTAAIDALIEKKQKLLDLLAEKRTALINRAVTKGLDPDVPMKDSGVPWIGEIPAHWDSVMLKLVARLESGHTPSRSNPDYWIPEECTIPWFALGDVWQLRSARTVYVERTKECVSELGVENSGARVLPAGTVMLSRTASVGFAGIMGKPMATTQDFANWVCGPRLLPEFLLWSLRGMEQEFARLKYGSTHMTIYMPDINQLQVAVPPVAEQRELLVRINGRVRGLDRAVDGATTQIAKLREYRQALITAAVTGQLDVDAA